MLIIRRRRGESIVIGEDIETEILRDISDTSKTGNFRTERSHRSSFGDPSHTRCEPRRIYADCRP